MQKTFTIEELADFLKLQVQGATSHLGNLAMGKHFTTEELDTFFPIQSQTTYEDKAFILNMIEVMKSTSKTFSYLEIGSFLGGSLAPFLVENACEKILSVDERGQQLPDERGKFFDYSGISSQTMIETLEKNNLSTQKLDIHDGSIETLHSGLAKFDLAFIDGVHTDNAVFRDYIYVSDHLKRDCVIMFHDSNLVAKGIVNILALANKKALDEARNLRHQKSIKDRGSVRFFKKMGSEMCCILIGKFADMDPASIFGEEEPIEQLVTRSAREMLQSKIMTLVKVNYSFEIGEPEVVKAY